MNIVYCTGTYEERIPQTKKCVERIQPWVDRVVIICDETVTEESKNWFREHDCEVYVHPWEDSMVKMRNQYLQKAQTGDWVVVSDPDELFCEELCKDLRKIVAVAEKDGWGLLLVSAHDVTCRVDGTVDRHVSGFMKNLIFKKGLGVRYEGVGQTKNVHETLLLPPGTKTVSLDKKYFYEHFKEEHEIWERAARNVFMGGGGNNVGDLNKAWKPLRQICAGLGLENWTQVREYLRKGNIDPRLKQWLIDHRFEGTNVEHEMMEFFIWYKWMHPEEMEGYEPIKDLKKASLIEAMEYVGRVHRETLGAKIDEKEKARLANAILDGKLEQKDFLRKLSGINTIALCVMGYHEALPMILRSVDICRSYVDEIHVQGDDFTEEDIRTLKEHGCQVHIEPWKENFSEYKNKLLAHANTPWVLVCDHDEVPTKELAEHLRAIVEASERGKKFNIVQLNCIDVTTDEKGEIIHTEVAGPRKQNLHVNVKDPYYGNPHVWLKPNYYDWKPAKVPYAYVHFKREGIEMVRAVRNVFLGGGGDNWRDKNELWVELRGITDELKIFTWKDFHEYLKKGNIDPRLKILFERMDKKPWHDNELKAFKRYYYELHPEEAGEKQVILAEVPMASQEKLGAPPSTPTEHVRVPLPINVQVGLSEEHVERVLMQSNLYWKMYKPRLDFARRWEEALKKTKIPHPKLDPDAIEYFKSQVPPNEFLHVLAFSLETAEALDKAGYKTVINTGENTDPHVLPFPNKYFDAIFYIEILQHTLAPFLAISEINRVLKDGGRVIVNAIDLSEEKVLSIMILSHLKKLMQLTDFRKLDENGRLVVYEKKS